MVIRTKTTTALGIFSKPKNLETWISKPMQGTEDKALGPCKVKSWMSDPCINLELMYQEKIKASNKSKEMKRELSHLNLSPEEGKKKKISP